MKWAKDGGHGPDGRVSGDIVGQIPFHVYEQAERNYHQKDVAKKAIEELLTQSNVAIVEKVYEYVKKLTRDQRNRA